MDTKSKQIISEWISHGDINKILYLNNLQLTELPDLPQNVKYLNCSNNLLTSLPTLPSSLKILICFRNQLTSLPDNLSQLNYLEELDCSLNKLTSLPVLPNSLMILKCYNNQITTIHNLPNNLQQLYCNHNNLTSLPDFPNSLKIFYFGNNPSLNLSEQQFNKLYGLEETDYHFNDSDLEDSPSGHETSGYDKSGYDTSDTIHFQTESMKRDKMRNTITDSCDMLTEAGDKCVFQTEYIKTTDGDQMTCKNYCYKHSDKIIEALRKKYSKVKINGVESNILETTVLINNKNVDTYTDYQIKKLMKTELEINIVVKTDNKYKIDEITSLEWLRDNINDYRWISNINWKITTPTQSIDSEGEGIILKSDKSEGVILSITYNISYMDNIKKQSRDDIFCSNSDVITTASRARRLGKGSYGETTRSDNIVVKKMDIFDRNRDFYINNLREMCFLTTYSHHYISHLKCLELIKPADIFKPDTKFKMHLKYEGVPLNNSDKLTTKDKNMNNNILFVLQQLIWLLCELEERGIIHGDLKPQNIVIDDDLKPTMIDWGAVSFNASCKKLANGTVNFIDPISFFPEEGQAVFSTKNDIFSVGMSILYLYDKDYYTEDELLDMFFKHKAKFNLKNVTDTKVQLILDDMLKIDILKRKSAKQLMNDYFPSSGNETRNITRPDLYKFKIREMENIDSGYLETLKLVDKNGKVADNYKVRYTIIEWLSEIASTFDLWKCYVLVCYIFDLYLSKYTNVNSTHLIQLIGIASFYIGYMIVYNDFKHNIDDALVKITAGAYNKKQFNTMVIKILNLLNFNVHKQTFESSLYNIVSSDFRNKTNRNFLVIVLRELMLDTNLIGANDSVYVAKFNKLVTKHSDYQIK